jgi:DNA polymerase III delta subunit
VNQEFQKDKRVTVVQLDAPVGAVLSSAWILEYCKKQGIAIESTASIALARALLSDEETAVLNVSHAQNEIEKLKQYADGAAITSSMVAELVASSVGVDIFKLLNAIATRNKKLALKMLEDYFDSETADEKANAIKVTALLSDQFRSLLIVADANDRRLQDEAVLAMTGWKSGRLYVMKKLARNFKIAQVKQALSKLENLDREMKTGSMPPHVVLDLIIADM